MRYILLVFINLPIIFLALLNIVTQYKTKKIGVSRFRRQIILWAAIFFILVGSFPLYNLAANNPLLDSHNLSLIDVVQTSALVYLFYIINDQRRKLEQNERTLREFHQSLSIELASRKKYGKS